MEHMKTLLTEKKQNTLYITLNRPEAKNALNQALILDLTLLLKKINHNADIHAVCLSGANHFFCAGADLVEMKEAIHLSPKENIEQATALSDLLDTLYNLEKPTVAVCEGGVFGGGLGLIACCDIVIAEKNTRFCFSEAKLGLIPAMISPYITRAIGERNAKRFFLTAEVFSAEKAKDINLVHEIADQDKLELTTQQLIKPLLQNSPNSLKQIKKLFPSVEKKAQQYLIQLLTEIRTSPEAQQRLIDFFQNKP